MGSKRVIRAALACAIVLAVISAGVVLFAQDQPKPAPAKSAGKDIVDIDAKVSRIPLDGNGPSTYKIVKFTHKDTVISSDLVTYDDKTKVAISPGKLTISDPECDISGDKGSANFKKKLGDIEGSVQMLIKPKPVQETPDNKNSVRTKVTKPTTVTCPKLEYEYKNKIATLTGGVSFKQEKRSATANKAVYDGKAEILTLTGDVKGIDEQGQTFAATLVRISMKKGDEWLEAENGTASVKVDLNEEDTGGSQQAVGNRQ